MRSIELTFDPTAESAFRAEWAALQEAGLPNLGRHSDSSNRPHLTLAAGPGLELTDALRAVFQTRPEPQPQSQPARRHTPLPVELRVSGLVLFRAGSGRFVLARPVVMTRALLELHRSVLEHAPGAAELTQPDRWTPHVTLARHISGDQVARALEILTDLPPAGTCVEARYWNGETKTLTPLL
ncbi:2'-5' RNA ligase family protein [Cryobacterium sp. PAMC25264]|uniref:2'-5' RNA ligase family protein n=1 Tax=Cryobacterium sp. PAMC25264 TaxID=2861288 RepID=UPI001C6320BE|nr:2'-5' RNA ligase family protein [Cryobacterium sp. PAMC25264]QYF74254.1 2'-5' RNA ligase family protein [Cryobacterium sp. PAMC25264]